MVGVLLLGFLFGMKHALEADHVSAVGTLDLTRSTAQALLYLAAFALGSVAGMAALSLVISLPLGRSSERLGAVWQVLEGALGVVTLGLGCWMAASLLGA